MRFFSPLLILAALFAAACGGAAVFPEVFSQERADGKIPVSIELIRKQTQKEIDGMPEKQATAERWRDIEADYNDCRVSSARKTKAEADKVFADCMSRKGYVYMLRLDAEQLHDEIAAEEPAKYAAEKKAEEEVRRAAELIRWVEKGNIAKIRALLNAGVNPNAAVRDDSWTALMIAATEDHLDITQMLLDAGANPNATKDNGVTALGLAVATENLEVVNALIAAGAYLNVSNNKGETVLMVAAWTGNSEITKILLAAGAYPFAMEDDGWTALMFASDDGHTEIVDMLLAAGASPTAANKEGQTVLMGAAANGYSEIIKMLLDAGANPNAKETGGQTALMFAAYRDHAEAVKMLLSAGANSNVRDNDDWTALMLATEQEKPEVVKILLQCGANPDIKNREDLDSWYWAKRRPIILPIFRQHIAEVQAGKKVSSCKERWGNFAQSSGNNKVATAKPPSETNIAEAVFENAWRSIVVIRQGGSQGSGIIVRPNVVATNCHVVDFYGKIVIYKHDNRRATADTTFNAVVRYRDDYQDFCLLDVVGLRGNSVKVRRYDTLKIGEDVYAVGSPKGLDLSLSSGIISQLRQDGGEKYIQTDASVSPGSSGGGLFDSDGNLVGILTSKLVDEEVEGIGFAIPAELVLNL